MAEPFVFHFGPDDAGRPCVLYIADILAECGLCRFSGIQRYYHNTGFHDFTSDKLLKLSKEVRGKASFECENCGTMVGSEHVLRTTITYGFPDESGEIRIFRDEVADEYEVRYLSARRLDPQELPGFDPELAPGKRAPTLGEESLEFALGRVFNVKRAWSEFLDDWQDDDGNWVRFSADSWGFAATSLAEVEAMLDELEAQDEFNGQDIEFYPFLESLPLGLATHEDPTHVFAGWEQWLPERHLTRIRSGEIVVGALVSWDAALEATKRAFEVAQLRHEEDDTGEDVVLRAITTPGDITYQRDLSIDSVLRRAVFTGITPGEAGRLTAEEIIGTMLRVWTVMEKK